jgi:DNA polymerase-3 subunit gamma/tau
VNLFTTLTSRVPQLKEKNLIEFMIDNKVQEDEIAGIKPELMAFLRGELQNYEVQLTTIITKNDADKKPYTGSDKFKRMAEKNPALNELRSKFDLEIDF